MASIYRRPVPMFGTIGSVPLPLIASEPPEPVHGLWRSPVGRPTQPHFGAIGIPGMYPSLLSPDEPDDESGAIVPGTRQLLELSDCGIAVSLVEQAASQRKVSIHVRCRRS